MKELIFIMRDRLLLSNIKFNTPFLLLYSVVTLVVILTSITGITSVNSVFTPLLISLLIVFISINTRLSTPHSKLIFLALVFSLIGDISLIPYFDDFVMGLSSFMIAHVFYILSFLGNDGFMKGLLLNKGLSIIVIIASILLISILVGSMFAKGEFVVIIISVAIYSVIVLVMQLAAISTYGSEKSRSSKIILIGSIILMVSDSIIAIDMFYEKIYMSQLFIISLYALAEWLIVKGSIIRYRVELKE